MVGWAGVENSIGLEAWYLFAIIFFWTEERFILNVISFGVLFAWANLLAALLAMAGIGLVGIAYAYRHPLSARSSGPTPPPAPES